jgi:glycerophosphoryl diester phosphodiesterase
MIKTTPGGRSGPLIIAHRGASAYAPENTVAAYELALDQGADLLEMDVHLSADDQPVMIHDFTLERTTDGRGRVREHTVRELKRLDAGSWFGRQYQGQRLQTLQEVVERFKERTRFAIELKGGSDFYPGIEERVVSLLQIYDVAERCLVLSFDHRALAKVREMDPTIRTGALVAHRPIDPSGLEGIATALCPAANLLTEEDTLRAMTAGLDTYVWVVNDVATMDRMIALGVTGILTDRPDLLSNRLRA